MSKKGRNIIITCTVLFSVVLIGLMVLLIGHIREEEKDSKEDEVVQEGQTQEPPEQIVIEVEEEEVIEDIEITISAVGDCTLGTDVNYASGATFVAEYNKQQDPAYFLRNVKPVFEADDLTIINFEGTFTDSGTRQDKTFAFRADPEYVKILTTSSVEAANLANNHSRDYGSQSLTDTRQHLSEAGITHFGYDETAIYEVKGVKIGLVGVYELPYGLGCMDKMKERIAKVKAEGAVITIVSFHWGIEREYYPERIQKELARTAVDCGADLVLGHHPHVLQGIETYNGKKIVYSLGNFCFGGNKNPSDKDTMIFQQKFTIREGKVLSYEDVNIIPCSLSSVSSRNNYQPMILEGDAAQRVLDKIQKLSDGITP